ncbi:RDD family protein [Chitinophaga sp.]|uniref:RDD family protein n=1 Tax=Chitinophaga sp. TaxID=1869181 RepID=UPI0026059FE9|nr:RDD family protein [uncultured Chitinophaga sp.]
MPNIKIPTVFNIDLEFEAADLGRRLVAYLLDLLIRGAYILLALYLIKKADVPYESEDMIEMLVVGLPVSLYYLVSELVMKGQSLGKRVMDIKVVSLMGNVPSISQVLLRWMFRLIESPLLTMLLIGAILSETTPLTALIVLVIGMIPVIMVLRSPLNQRLGDMAAGTILVRTRQRHSLEDTIFREIAVENYEPQFPQILRLSDRDLSKIKSVIDGTHRSKDHVMAERISFKIKEVLHIESDMPALEFLETLLNDYNYLVTRK